MNTTVEKLWSRDFVLILFYKMFTTCIFMTLTTVLASYSFITYDVSPSMAGIIVGMFIIGAVVSRVILGKYTDSIGRKRLLVLGTGGYLVAMLLYLVPMDMPLFIVLRFIHGSMFGIVSNTSVVISTTMMPVSRYGEGLGYMGVFVSIANIVGPLSGLNLAAAFGYQSVFIGCAAVTAAALLMTFPMNVKEVDPEKIAATKSPGFKVGDFIDFKSVPLATVAAIIGLGISSSSAFIDPYTQSIDLAWMASMFFVVNSLTLIITRPFFGRIQDRRSDNLVMYPSLVSFVAGFLVLAAFPQPVGFFIGSVLTAIGIGNCNAVTQASVARSAGDRMSLAISTFYTLLDTGTGVGPSILGMVVDGLGYRGMFVVAAFIIAGGGVFYHVVHGRSAGRIDRSKVGLDSTNVE